MSTPYFLQDHACPVEDCPWRFCDPDNAAQHLDEEHDEASRWPLFGKDEQIKGTDTGKGESLIYDDRNPNAWLQSDFCIPIGGETR